VQVAALDALGQVDLLGGREQGVAARVREQLVDRLGDERVGCAQIDLLDGAVEPAGLRRRGLGYRVAVDVGRSRLEDLLGLGYYGAARRSPHTQRTTPDR
jgi:hypothetical protein